MLTNIIYRFQYKPLLSEIETHPKICIESQGTPNSQNNLENEKKKGGGFKLLDIQMSLKLQDLGSYPVTSREFRSGLMRNFWKWREQMVLPHCQFLDVTE